LKNSAWFDACLVKGESVFGSYAFLTSCFAILVSSAASTGLAATHHKLTLSTPSSDEVVEVTDLQPFTHSATIPVGGDVSSIRMESIKPVKVATSRRSVSKYRYCDQPASDPGGSIDCRRITDESYVPAYQVTYSYRGEPMASDEYGNNYFTFSVYFRPDEIGPDLRRILSLGKVNGAAAAEFFQLTTWRDSIQQVAIDEASSTICDGNYVDGNWVHTGSKCEDEIAYTTVEIPSPYITVKVAVGSGR
jgi:hypothetical protein